LEARRDRPFSWNVCTVSSDRSVKSISAKFVNVLEDVMRHCDDGTAATRRLKDIEHFPDASPKQFRGRQIAKTMGRALISDTGSSPASAMRPVRIKTAHGTTSR
jgi:hypothetical protein